MTTPAATTTPNFNRLARAYRWMEWASFGPFLSLCRSTFLPRLAHCRNALILGDGDGRFAARLLRQNLDLRAHCIDASPAMLASLARACRPNATRLTTEQTDLRTWQPGPSTSLPTYDLIVTHFFLDCLSTAEILDLALRIKQTLAPGTLWLVSEFAIPSGWFGALIAGPLVRALYLAFGLLTGLQPRTLPNHPSALRAAGFKCLSSRPRLGGLLVSELWIATGPVSPHPPAQPPPV